MIADPPHPSDGPPVRVHLTAATLDAAAAVCEVRGLPHLVGRLELARALTDRSDRGEQRVYAGHQLRDLLLLARRDTAGRKAAYQALNTTLRQAAGFDTFGHNCGCCGRPSAFINDQGRCTRPACREAKT